LEGSSKPACLEIKQYTSPLVYAADNTLGRSLHNTGKHTEALVVASNEIGQEVNSDKTRSYLKIKMQDEDTIQRLKMVPLKEWNSSNNWEQP
jgi:predicted RNA-binding protein